MEKIIEKLFDIKKIPVKFFFVIWICSLLLLFLPAKIVEKLKLDEFIAEYGKYVGLAFIFCSAFLIVTLVSFLTKRGKSKRYIKSIEETILKSINNLDSHEKALLREFVINGKSALQLPFDNDTVQGLVNKHVIYQISDTGFAYRDGMFFSYSITGFADDHLTNNMLDIPSDISDADRDRILNSRPVWAMERAKWDNIRNARW